MCGLVGVAGDIDVNLKKVFEQMLFVDQLRGPHSTGVAGVKNYDQAVSVAKVVGGFDALSEMKSYDEILKNYNKVLLGHNRFATIGKITRNNAHPFNFEHIVGAHNGSLRRYMNLKGYYDFPVDSQVLYNSINEDGLETTLANVEGAYALTFWDKRTQKMNFIRNTERPLFIGWTKNEKAIIWASEEWMIEGICARNGVELSAIFGIEKDTLLTVHIPTVKEKLVPHIRPELKGGTALAPTGVVVPFRGNGFSGGNNPTNVGTTGTGTTSGTQVSTATTQTGAKAEETAKEIVASLQCPIGRGELTFTAGAKGCTADGAKYVTLELEGDPREYRLYLKKSDYGCYTTGDKVKGRINSMEVYNNDIVYKMQHLSAENLTTKEKDIIDVAALRELVEGVSTEEEVPFDQEDTYDDHMGRPLNKADFMKKFSFCAYCSGNIDPDLGYRFIKDECLCDSCMVNKVIVDCLTD